MSGVAIGHDGPITDHQVLHIQQWCCRGQRIMVAQVWLAGCNKLPGIGLCGFVQDLPGWAFLLHAAIFEHNSTVGHLGYNGQIVGYVNTGKPTLAHGDPKSFQHFYLRCDIQRSGRLIKNDHFRLGYQRHGRHDPLELPPRTFMRVARANDVRRGQGHHLEQRNGVVHSFLAGENVVGQGGFDHLLHKGRAGLKAAPAFWAI